MWYYEFQSDYQRNKAMQLRLNEQVNNDSPMFSSLYYFIHVKACSTSGPADGYRQQCRCIQKR